jgi:2-polyprenyl-6-methoxyphenol hydroxylase-like FAD-dependent oxidoreductase
MHAPGRPTSMPGGAAAGDPSSSQERRTVVVVGAGPTGLLLAGDLAAAGADTLVLERRADASNLTRAFAVHARTLELLDARGLADDLVAAGRPVPALRLFGRAEVELGRLPSRYPFVLVVPQYTLEALLEARAREQGAELRAGHEVVDLHQDGTMVTVTARDPGGVLHEIRADYVVGCDGVHSSVRRAMGMPFPGRSAVRSVMLADVRLAQAPADVLTVGAGPDGFAFLAPFGDGWYRVIAWDRHDQHDDEPVDFDRLVGVIRRVLGEDFGMSDPRWTSRFHSDERQVPAYRFGRVLLAGDAAHVHSPAGGQGMNTGLQDAVNLSWKLARVAGGRAPAGLLDSYQGERHPVGQRVLTTSGALLRLVMVPGPLRCRLRDAVVGGLTRFPPAARRIAGRISGLDVSYPRSSGDHPRVGRRVGDCEVAAPDGSHLRLYELLRAGRFVVLLPPEDSRLRPQATSTDSVAALSGDTGKGCIVVRPDGYVAAVLTDSDPDDRARALRETVQRWCGAGLPPVAPPLSR